MWMLVDVDVSKKNALLRFVEKGGMRACIHACLVLFGALVVFPALSQGAYILVYPVSVPQQTATGRGAEIIESIQMRHMDMTKLVRTGTCSTPGSALICNNHGECIRNNVSARSGIHACDVTFMRVVVDEGHVCITNPLKTERLASSRSASLYNTTASGCTLQCACDPQWSDRGCSVPWSVVLDEPLYLR